MRPRAAWVLGLAASLLLVGTWGADRARDVLSNTTEPLSPAITNNRNVAPTADIVVSSAPNLPKAQAVPASVVKAAGIPTSKTVSAASVPDVAAAAAVVEIPAVVVAPPVTAPVVGPPVAAAPVAPLTSAEQTALDAFNAAALTARNAKAAPDLTAANALAAANLTAANAAAAAEAVRLQAAANAWVVAHPNG